MTKADLIKNVAEETGIIKGDVAVVVNSLFDAIKEVLDKGHHIEIRGFGTFNIKKRKARIGRNPKTNEEIPVPEKIIPIFKFSRQVKKSVLEKN